jgi:FKBP-type peptidyl-prolyl cis-trans isomerase
LKDITIKNNRWKELSFVSLLFLIILCPSCREDDGETQLKEDIDIIETYVNAYEMQGSYVKEGIYKTQVQAGTGEIHPVTRNGVYLNYKLMLPNKTIINQENRILTQQGLEQFFEGFDVAVSTMTKGEKSQFFIASDLAFGATSYTIDGQIIPSNAVIFLEVELLEIIEEGEIIDFYIAKQGKAMEKTASGLYYSINHYSTSTKKPEVDDIVTLEYTNYYISDTIVAQNQSLSFGIVDHEDWDETSILDGIEEGILKMNEGDEAEFIIPASLAYYSYDDNSISRYAILRYKLKLKEVK